MTLGLTCDVIGTFRYSAVKLFIKELDFGSRWVEVGHRQLALAKLDPTRAGLLNRRTMLEERPSKTTLSRWTVSDGRCSTITVRLMRAFSRSTTDPEIGSGGTCCHRVLSWSTTSMTSDWTAVSRLMNDISYNLYGLPTPNAPVRKREVHACSSQVTRFVNVGDQRQVRHAANNTIADLDHFDGHCDMASRCACIIRDQLEVLRHLVRRDKRLRFAESRRGNYGSGRNCVQVDSGATQKRDFMAIVAAIEDAEHDVDVLEALHGCEYKRKRCAPAWGIVCSDAVVSPHDRNRPHWCLGYRPQ